MGRLMALVFAAVVALGNAQGFLPTPGHWCNGMALGASGNHGPLSHALLICQATPICQGFSYGNAADCAADCDKSGVFDLYMAVTGSSDTAVPATVKAGSAQCWQKQISATEAPTAMPTHVPTTKPLCMVCFVAIINYLFGGSPFLPLFPRSWYRTLCQPQPA